MLDVGRVCMKIAGRDAGKYCVIVNVDGNRYEVDGQTRRRKVSALHLEPTEHKVNVSAGADHAAVAKALKDLGHECTPTKKKDVAPRPKKQRKQKAKPEAKK